MLLVHLDGTGEGQWAVLLEGASYISIPWAFGSRARTQINLLQPITANMIKHHTAIPYRAVVELSGPRKKRRKLKAAQAYGNHVIADQRLNSVIAEALWMGAPYGHCPVHFQWRTDISHDPYQPLYLQGDEAAEYSQKMRKGFVDAYCGDPWNTVYNEGATRNSVHRMCYARSVPLKLLQAAYPNVPGIMALKGRTDLPSVSRFQQAGRRAMMQAGTGKTGSHVLDGGRSGGEEIVVILCDELAPGIDPQWPTGRLSVVALDGVATVDDNATTKMPLHLHTGALPAGRFSAIRIYPTDSFDDVHGRPWLANLDDLQRDLNQLATLQRERIRRFARTQLLAQTNSLEDDTLLTVDDAIIYYTGDKPTFLTPPPGEVGFISQDMMNTMEAMFRIGGWQASSRGEGKAGDAHAKVVALAAMDDSIFSSANRMLQDDVCQGLTLATALAKENLVVPTPLKGSGIDLGYRGEITSFDLPDDAVTFALTQGSASPEARLQQNMNMVTTLGGDGAPLMTTEQFHESNPDPSLRPVMSEVSRQRRLRPIEVADTIEDLADGFIEQNGEPSPETLDGIAQWLNHALWQELPVEDGDDPQLNIDALDELILDTSVHKLARAVARLRRDGIAQWQAQKQAYEAMMASMSNAQQGMMQGPMGQQGGTPPGLPSGEPGGGGSLPNGPEAVFA